MKRIRNPHFDEESKIGASWTRVNREGFPAGRACLLCEKNAKHDEVVITFPAKNSAGRFLSTNIIHKKCMIEFLEVVPDQLSVVQARVANIKQAFLRD